MLTTHRCYEQLLAIPDVGNGQSTTLSLDGMQSIGSVTITDQLAPGSFLVLGVAAPATVVAANQSTPVEYVTVSPACLV